MTESFTYHPERAWRPLPCGGRALLPTAEPERFYGHVPERAPKASRNLGMAVRSLADVEAAQRAKGPPKLNAKERARYGEGSRFNPAGHLTDARGRMRYGSRGGGEVQRVKFESTVMARMAEDPSLMRNGDLELVSLELVRSSYGKAQFRVRCVRVQASGEPCGNLSATDAGPWSKRARDVPKACVHCARKANARPRVRRVAMLPLQDSGRESGLGTTS